MGWVPFYCGQNRLALATVSGLHTRTGTEEAPEQRGEAIMVTRCARAAGAGLLCALLTVGTGGISAQPKTSSERDGENKAWLTLEGHRDGIFSLAFSPDGKLLASASRD